MCDGVEGMLEAIAVGAGDGRGTGKDVETCGADSIRQRDHEA